MGNRMRGWGPEEGMDICEAVTSQSEPRTGGDNVWTYTTNSLSSPSWAAIVLKVDLMIPVIVHVEVGSRQISAL